MIGSSDFAVLAHTIDTSKCSGGQNGDRLRFDVQIKGVEYVLCCEPMDLADGRFGAQIVITLGLDGGEIMDRRFPFFPGFRTKAEAVEFARVFGINWIHVKC